MARGGVPLGHSDQRLLADVQRVLLDALGGGHDLGGGQHRRRVADPLPVRPGQVPGQLAVLDVAGLQAGGVEGVLQAGERVEQRLPLVLEVAGAFFASPSSVGSTSRKAPGPPSATSLLSVVESFFTCAQYAARRSSAVSEQAVAPSSRVPATRRARGRRIRR